MGSELENGLGGDLKSPGPSCTGKSHKITPKLQEKHKKSSPTAFFFSAGEWRLCFILARINRNRFILTLPGLCRENHSIHGIYPKFIQAKPREIDWFNARRSQITQFLHWGSCWLLIISAFISFFIELNSPLLPTMKYLGKEGKEPLFTSTRSS